ncbi:MarR family winged helix-turn-helix transcriptional regulator [Sabulicella rubraurantiaca]|uniref:MarR family winged helix-turn-helix transcriptional regulator n=1 Tax=Sabulicella rubraurantiaca TaxID=2811429 RepID=UPI001A961728|nr:MarR family transcriptional regulator [Sabulicella rubraurantiaca]
MEPAPTVSRPALMPDGTDAAFRAMVHDTLAFAARIEEVRRLFGELIDLSASSYTLLITVRHLQKQDGVSVSEAATHLHLSGSAVTIEANRLSKLGLVTRHPDPQDRRRVLLRVTPLAEARLRQLAPVQAQANDALFACLDAEGFRRFAGTMRGLVGCAEDALGILEHATRRKAG